MYKCPFALIGKALFTQLLKYLQAGLDLSSQLDRQLTGLLGDLVHIHEQQRRSNACQLLALVAEHLFSRFI
ncbi:hypothetical protein D3C73_1650790 [compost metagenome]